MKPVLTTGTGAASARLPHFVGAYCRWGLLTLVALSGCFFGVRLVLSGADGRLACPEPSRRAAAFAGPALEITFPLEQRDSDLQVRHPAAAASRGVDPGLQPRARSTPEEMHFALPRQATESPLTVHEWGTFTSIAGPDGLAMDWLPLTGSTDLPRFVEHLGDVNFKGGLRGTIRMETPVLYFYSSQESTVSVRVTFPKGLITEWYPRASAVQKLDPRRDFFLSQLQAPGSISWKSVHIQPGAAADFPVEPTYNHYYAARETTSAPLTVDTPAGPQRERFLFYRGVSAFLPPLTATLSPDGTVHLQNHFLEPIPNMILFERRGSKLGYRILGPLRDQASFTAPTLDGSLEALFSDLEGLLISQGLYPDEAHAMLETWKNSWFEEGSRIIYILPRRFVDSALPLSIAPAPAQITRVFVGRLELVTPTTQQAVESAFGTNDRATLAKYNRFLEPILSSMIQQSTTDPARQRRLSAYLDSVYTELSSQAAN
jgi:hypothetical protein